MNTENAVRKKNKLAALSSVIAMDWLQDEKIKAAVIDRQSRPVPQSVQNEKIKAAEAKREKRMARNLRNAATRKNDL